MTLQLQMQVQQLERDRDRALNSAHDSQTALSAQSEKAKELRMRVFASERHDENCAASSRVISANRAELESLITALRTQVTQVMEKVTDSEVLFQQHTVVARDLGRSHTALLKEWGSTKGALL